MNSNKWICAVILSVATSFSTAQATISCEQENILGFSNLECQVPEQDQKVKFNLSVKAKQRLPKFCGNISNLNCDSKCVGYLTQPKKYGCAANFSGGPIASVNCEDVLLTPEALAKMKLIANKCAEIASLRNQPQQPQVENDTQPAMPPVAVGGSDDFEPKVENDVEDDLIFHPAGN